METQKTNECPSPDRLRGLLSGELLAGDQDSVTRHIEACISCQRTLDHWLSSPSVEGLAAAGKDSATQEAALRELMEHVKKKSVGAMTQAESEAVSPDDLAYLKPSNKPGTLGRLHHYDILQILGKGGFGTVFKAFDTKLQRMVAIKVLAPELAANGSARKRFIREAQAAAAIKNEHVVAIYNVEDEHQPPYIAMEIIDGISLQDRVDQAGSLELKEILRIGMQIAEGLASAHKQGLIHRDIKPANILLENGVQRVKITDFGLARLADDASITQSGVIAGTPMYMSPEQAEGLPIDVRSDLFSLGSVLYTLSAGHPPFRANTTMAVLKRVCEETPRPICEINSELPDWLSDIVTKLHAKQAKDRYQTARQVADLLGEKLAELQFTGRANAGRAEGRNAPVETPATESINRPLTRHGSPKLLAGALAVVALVATVAFLAVLGVIFWPRSEVAPPEKKLVENKTPDEKKTLPEEKPEGKKTPPAPKDEWVSLFNGKDLTGWKTQHPENAKVTDGCLVLDKVCYLRLKAPYRDYQLRFDAKVNQFGAASVAVRWAYPRFASVRLCPSGKHGWTGQLSFNWSGEKFNHYGSPGRDLAGADTWFAVEITAQGNDVKVKIDGHETARASIADLPEDGVIELGSMGASAPDTVVHFRKIEIKELPPPTPPAAKDEWVSLFNGKDLTGWNARPEEKWQVSGNLIIGEGPGFFVSEKSYENFHCRIEAKLNQNGHGGIAFRVNGKDAYASVTLGNKYTHKTGSLRNVVPSKPAQEESVVVLQKELLTQPDAWFTVDILLRDKKILVKINGKLTAEHTVDQLVPTGNIIIGAHEPQTVVHIRKIEIKELPPTPPVPKDEWGSLFNGKDLTGWKTISGRLANWRVEDGQLIGKAGGPDILLFSDKGQFDDFHLRAEAKLNANGNSGLIFRSKFDVVRFDKGQAPAGYEADISFTKHSSIGTLWNGNGPIILKPADKTEIAPDQWFTIEVVARGPRLKVLVEGKTVAEFTDPTFDHKKGLIALQAITPGTEVRFRKIEIKELPPTPPAPKDEWVSLFNGKDLTGWKTQHPENAKVTDGCLVLEKVCYLNMKAPYRDYQLRFDAKVNQFGAANVAVRYAPPRAAIVRLCPSGKHGWTGQLNFHWASGKYQNYGSPGRDLAGADTWFTVEITARGNNVKVKINGHETADASIDDLPEDGVIELGSIGNAEPDTVVRFRKIEIKELPPTPPAAPQPFVVLAKANRAETQHATLAAAVAVAQSGDTIEIQGNGPFLTGAMTFPQASLCIRAGAAYRPIIEQNLQSIDEGKNLFSIHGVLILEGLELRRDGSGKFVNTGRWSIVRGEKPDAAAYATNCRFICKKSGYCLDQSLHRMTLRNCEFFSGWSGVAPSLSLPTEIRIENSIICADEPLRWQLSGPYKGTIYLRENTVVGHSSAWNVRFWDYSDRDRGGPIRFEATRNLFLGKHLVHLEPRKAGQLLQFEDAKNAMRESFAWVGNSNIHPPCADGLLLFNPTNVEKSTKRETAIRDLAAWNQFWKDTDKTSRQGEPLFENANVAKIGLEAPEKLTPADFRLAKGSPGQGVLPGGKDLGADVDLVGPGEAYERWKKTPAYQEWRKQTDALMATAAALQPFVVLAKANRAETRHPTLAAAVAAAQSGDTIEIQGNGPFDVSEAIELDTKPLTIRAASGFSPTIRRAIIEGNKRGHDYLFITRAPLVLEGFEFHLNNMTTDRYLSVLLSHNAKVRIANCQVAGKGAGSLLVTQNGVGAEIRNCFTLFESNTSVTIDGRVGENNTQVSIQNGIFYGGNATFGVHYPREPKSSHRVEVASSTILPNRLAQVRFDKLPKSRAENPTLVELSVRENIVKAVRVMRVESRDPESAFGRNETERIQKDHLRLTDQWNLFASSQLLDYWQSDPKTWKGKAVADAQKVVTIPEWNELWQLRDTGSVIGEPRFAGTDLANRVKADPYKLQPADFRLAKGSPGQGVLPGGKDLGADVDLVGPGEPYERWKKTPAYQEWRKKTEELMNR